MPTYGTNDFWPSVWECVQARLVFTEAVQRFSMYGGMSMSLIVKNAMSEVWRAGRLYQAIEEQSQTRREAARAFQRLRGDASGKGGASDELHA